MNIKNFLILCLGAFLTIKNTHSMAGEAASAVRSGIARAGYRSALRPNVGTLRQPIARTQLWGQRTYFTNVNAKTLPEVEALAQKALDNPNNLQLARDIQRELAKATDYFHFKLNKPRETAQAEALWEKVFIQRLELEALEKAETEIATQRSRLGLAGATGLALALGYDKYRTEGIKPSSREYNEDTID